MESQRHFSGDSEVGHYYLTASFSVNSFVVHNMQNRMSDIQ